MQEAVDVVEDVLFGDGLAVLTPGSFQDEVTHAVALDVLGICAGVKERWALLGLLLVVCLLYTSRCV